MSLSPEEKRLAIRRSTELLRQGATMLGLQCPKCGSPLFKLRSGEVVCPLHGRVIIAESESDVTTANIEARLERLEKALLNHLDHLTSTLEHSPTPEPSVLEDLSRLLDLLQKTRALRKQKATENNASREREKQ